MNKKPSSLDDGKVNVKVKLALFWVALMFLYIYNDILSTYQPGHVADLLEGHLEGVQFTQSLLFGAAALMALPSFMILMTLTFRARATRLINIISGIFHILLQVGTQFVGDSQSWWYWRFYEFLEVLILILITWTAWKWPASQD